MIILAFGANLPGPYGSPESTIQKALSLLPGRGVDVVNVSNIWLTPPVPDSDQPWYRNAVAVVRTYLSPQDLLHAIKAMEKEFGRDSDERNAPRVLDIDILCYDDLVIDLNDLILPHPRMHERGFVLYPLQEIVGSDWRHPILGIKIVDLLQNLPLKQKLETPQGIAA